MKAVARKERLEARLTRQQKKLFQQAAEIQGRSITDFVVTSAQEAATRVIREDADIRLSAEARETFVAALLNPPVLTGRLGRALEQYRHLLRR